MHFIENIKWQTTKLLTYILKGNTKNPGNQTWTLIDAGSFTVLI